MLPSNARGEDEPQPGPNEQQLSEFLAQKPASADVSKAPEAPEAPPPPPRRHGFVVESSIGAQGQLGSLNHVSPTSPWFHTAFGWEPTHWFMVLAQFDFPSRTRRTRVLHPSRALMGSGRSAEPAGSGPRC
jgi:hypothetical protein